MRASLWFALCLAHGLALAGGAVRAQDYCPVDVTGELGDLDTSPGAMASLGSNISTPVAVNTAGHVIRSDLSGSETHIFLWDAAQGMTDLGVSGQARALNSAGQVAGWSYTADFRQRAFLWDPVDGMVPLGDLGGGTSAAAALNDAGQVAGTSATDEGRQHAFRWDPDEGIVDLGHLGGGDSEATAVNDAGQVTGWSFTADYRQHAFLWDEVKGMTDLGTLGGGYSQAFALNDAGQVAGASTNAYGGLRAFLWDPVHGMVDLGTRGGDTFSALNDAGQVTGYYDEAGTVNQHAFSWDPVVGMTDLGTLGGQDSYGVALNAAGQVAGHWRTASGARHAFLWDRVLGMTDLGHFGGDDSEVVAMNDAGQVAGMSALPPFETAYLWSSVWSQTDLGHLGYPSTRPAALNEADQVAGTSYTADFKLRAFRWDPDEGIVDLGHLGGGTSAAAALNDAGQVAGTSSTDEGEQHAFFWDPDTRLMTDLGTLGGTDSFAVAVNDAGQVAGTSETANGERHAFRWDLDTRIMIDLGHLGGFASDAVAVNDAGQVAGTSATDEGEQHAFRWDPARGMTDPGMTDLGTLGGFGSNAVALNDAGQVAGTSSNADGEKRAFLWDPVGPTMTDLQTLGGFGSEAVAMNALGHIVGTSFTADGSRHAFLWDRVNGMTDLGHLGGGESSALAMSDGGHVIGFSGLHGSDTRPFSWSLKARASDAGGAVRMSWADAVTPSCGLAGTVRRTFTATDPSGNIATCVQTLTSVDTTPPELTCAPDVTVEVGAAYLTDLGTLGGNYSYAVALNDAGQVVGDSRLAEYRRVAFRWDPVLGMTKIDSTFAHENAQAKAINAAGQVAIDDLVIEGVDDGRLPRAFLWDAVRGGIELGQPDGGGSFAVALNDGGQAAGTYYHRQLNDDGECSEENLQAFLWDPVGGRRYLGTLGYRDSAAVALNAAGQVAGVLGEASDPSSDDGPRWHASFFWDPVQGMTEVRMPDGFHSQAAALNDAGQVAGGFYYAYASSVDNGEVDNGELVFGPRRAFLWDPVRGLTDLGTLGGDTSYALALNAGGQVAGYSFTAYGERRAFLWDRVQGMMDLGHLGGWESEGTGMNDAGQVVGTSATADGERHAFVWDPVEGMTDLGTLGGDNSNAVAVNAFGQVAGSSDTAYGQHRAFLWDPDSSYACDDLGPTGTASASDDSGPPTLTYSDLATPGRVTRTWTATDACGHVATCQQAIDAPPRIVAPSGVYVRALGGATAVPVTYAVSVRTHLCGAANLDVSPPSGSLFPIGVTPVVVTATDAGGHVSTRTFDVTVTIRPFDVSVDEAKVDFDVTRSKVTARGALGLNGGWVAANLVRGATRMAAHARLTLAGEVIADEDIELRVRSGGKKWEFAASGGATGIKKLYLDWKGAGGKFSLEAPFDATALGLTVNGLPRLLVLELRLGNPGASVSGTTSVTAWTVRNGRWKFED